MNYIRTNPEGLIIASGEATTLDGAILQAKAGEFLYITTAIVHRIDDTKLALNRTTLKLELRPGVTGDVPGAGTDFILVNRSLS